MNWKDRSRQNVCTYTEGEKNNVQSDRQLLGSNRNILIWGLIAFLLANSSADFFLPVQTLTANSLLAQVPYKLSVFLTKAAGGSYLNAGPDPKMILHRRLGILENGKTGEKLYRAKF